MLIKAQIMAPMWMYNPTGVGLQCFIITVTFVNIETDLFRPVGKSFNCVCAGPDFEMTSSSHHFKVHNT